MLWNNTVLWGAGILLIVAAMGFLFTQQKGQFADVHACIAAQYSGAEEIGCLYRAIEDAVDAKGLRAGMQIFSYAYEHSEPFVQAGCHRHAHKVGDIAYYNLYLANPNIEEMDFPQETTACGYGFFHGFVEHLVQDSPDPEVVTRLCTHMGEKYGSTMGDIELTCYHGAGHGFMLAQIEKQPQENWGDVSLFAREPIELCNALQAAKEGEQEECRQGIFNVIIEWGEEKNYGFSYEKDDPLVVCDGLPEGWMHACLYEAAQKYDGVVRQNPAAAWRRAESISKQHALMIFSVAVAGVVQQTITDDSYEDLARTCLTMPEAVRNTCVESIVYGLFEHGEPTKEYKKALEFCSGDVFLGQREAKEQCARAVSNRLARFYTPSRIENICPQIKRVSSAVSCPVVSGRE